MAEQLIKRSVYTDAGELIRSGLVPKNIENKRPVLMKYWEEEDRRVAEEEAAKAEAATQESAEPPEPSASDVVAPLVERLESAESELGILRNLKQATPDFVLEGVHQIARAAGAAALVEAAAKTAIASVDAAAAGAQALLKKIDGQVGETAAAVGQLLSDSKLSLARTQDEMLARTTNAISKRIAGLEVQAAQLRGPTGARGRIGQGLIAGAGKRPENRPDGSQWALGDSYLNVKPEGYQLEYLSADGWSKPVRMVPEPKLINASVTHVDQAPKTTVVLGSSTKGGGGSGGAQRLALRTLTSGLAGTLVDSSAWSAAGAEIHAAEILLRVSTGVGSAFLAATLNMNADGRNWEYTEYSLLGELTNVAGFEVDLRPYLGAPVFPVGVTVPAAGVKQAFFVDATIRGAAGAYFLEGAVTYLVRAEGRTSTLTGAEPLWQVL